MIASDNEMNKESLCIARAIAFSSEIIFDDILAMLPWAECERIEANFLQVTLGREKRVLIFRFRGLVFIGFTEEEYRSTISSICEKITALEGSWEEDEFTIQRGVAEPQVAFHSLSIPEWDIEFIHVLGQVLARSCALSLVEREVDIMLTGSEAMTSGLQKRASSWSNRKQIISHLQRVLRLRHRLIIQLSLLRDPDVVWDNEMLDRIYRRLMENFDFEDRIESVEKMLELSSEVSRLQLETISTKRSEMLEIIIILLILFEVLHTLFSLISSG
ncbi:RMD1 family protein [bacterium]|nr:RMD1 family protein [bacterium]